jgi:hypothetical protein
MNTSRNKSTASFISRLRTNAPSSFAFSSQPGGITDSNRLNPASSPLIPSAYLSFYALLSKRIWVLNPAARINSDNGTKRIAAERCQRLFHIFAYRPWAYQTQHKKNSAGLCFSAS